MSDFDPDSFLNETVEGAMSTAMEPIPEGEYLAVISSKDKAVNIRKTQKGGAVLDITWEIQDAELQEKLNREVVTVRQSIFLDITPQGTMDRSKGKNVGLGKLRAALNQNDPSRPWSVGMLVGCGPATIKVTQRPSPDDDSIIYNDVKGVTAA